LTIKTGWLARQQAHRITSYFDKYNNKKINKHGAEYCKYSHG